MANLKFSGFTAAAAIDQTDSFIVGFDNDGGGANPTNNKWTFSEVAVGLPTFYAGNGSINEDRVVTVGLGAGNNTYTTSFESTKNNGTAERNSSGNILQIKETYTGQIPVSYSQTRGAILKLHATNSSGTENAESYIHSFIVNSGGSDYVEQDQMGFRTNRAFVFKATDTSWPIYFAVAGGPSNNPRQMIYSPGDGGLLQLKAGNAKTTKITIADTSPQGGSSGYYRYIEGGNNGNLVLGRKLSGGSEEAYITCSGVGGYTGNIAVGINQSTPTETLEVGGNCKITGQGYTALYANATNLVVDWNESNVQTVTVNSSSPTFAPTNPRAGATYILTITQGATPVTVDWNSLVKWPGGTAPTLSAVTGKIDVITLICYDDSTTNGLYYGSATLDLA